MNLVDKLLKADAKRAEELETGVFHSKRLAKILKEEKESVEVVIKEINSRRINDILMYQVNSKGDVDYSKVFDAKVMVCVEGIVDPDMRNKDLQLHFGCRNARDLVEKLFGNEVTKISDAISELSGIGSEEETEEEIKN